MEKMRSMRKECKRLVTKMSSKLPEGSDTSADKAKDAWTKRDENIPAGTIRIGLICPGRSSCLILFSGDKRKIGTKSCVSMIIIR